MDQTNLILLLLLGLGIVSNNNSVSIAVGTLLLLRLLHFQRIMPWIESNGVQVGIIILTIGVLSPLASGKIGVQQLLSVFKQPIAIIGIAAGILVAYLGGRGVSLLSSQPLAVSGILLGTIVGVSLFKGVPVGPLIAAGGVGVLLQMFQSR